MTGFVEFQWHPEVWLLVAFLTGAYIYMVRVIGPKAVRPGEPPVTRRQWVAFGGAMAMLWFASDWPMHDVAEQYLYSAHMFQHMILSYFMPPLALMATPTWLMRVLLGEGRLYATVKWFTRPVPAGVIFNASVMILHIPLLVTTSVSNPMLHYALHVMVVTTSLLMWMPVVGPIPEFRLGPLATSIYLFMQSVVPTLPAGWLVFAEGVVYAPYGEQSVRLWGIDAITDQQFAGAVMKIGGGVFLWTIVVYVFFTRFATDYKHEHQYRRRTSDLDHLPAGDRPLTMADVEREFANSPAAAEPD